MIARMTADQMQIECERGQAQLMRMEYLEAEKTLAAVEKQAWAARDWDTISRLYMPLQETRRQRRQRAGEGIVCLDLISEDPADNIDPMHVVQNFSHGQLLVAGWGTIAPAVRVRELATQHGLYLDTFLAAAYPTDIGIAVAILPLAESPLPAPTLRTEAELKSLLPAGSLVLRKEELPTGSRPGTFQSYGQVMSLWERLHTPFVRAADAQTDPILKLEGCRTTTQVDYACELAHQKLADVAKRVK